MKGLDSQHTWTGFLAAIARLGVTTQTHSLHRGRVELDRSVWSASVAGFRTTEKVEVEVASAGCSHGDGRVVVICSGCLAW